MKIYRRSLMVVIIVWLSAAALLVSCGTSQVRIGWVGTNIPGRIAYSYDTFTGTEAGSVPAEAGETIALDYQVTVSKGSLSIEVQDPNGETVWQVTLQGSEANAVEIPVDRRGRYQVVITGRDAGGGFDVSWEMKVSWPKTPSVSSLPDTFCRMWHHKADWNR